MKTDGATGIELLRMMQSQNVHGASALINFMVAFDCWLGAAQVVGLWKSESEDPAYHADVNEQVETSIRHSRFGQRFLKQPQLTREQ